MRIQKQSVFYNAFFLCLSSIGLQIIGFVYRIGLSRFGGAQVMGMYQLVMPVYSIITAFTMSGLTLSVSRLSAEYHSLGNTGGVRGVIRFSQIVFLGLFLCAAVPVCLFPGQISSNILGEPKVQTALLLLLPCIFLTGYENIFKSSFHGIKFITAPIVSELTEQIVRAISGLGLLIVIAPSDPGVATALIIVGMIISEVFSVVILSAFYRFAKKKRLQAAGATKIPKGILKKVAAIAVPVSSAGLLNNFLSSATTVLIPHRLMAAGVPHQEAMASFGVMVGMTMPLLMLPSAFIHPLNTVLLPRFSQYNALGSEAQTRRKAGKAIQITSILIAPSLAIMLPLGNMLAKLIYNQPAAGDHILLLSIATFFTFYHITTGNILNGIGMQKKASASIVLTGVSEIILTWFSVGKFGIAGYALACIGCEIIGVAMNFYWVVHGAKISVQWKNWFATPFLSGGAAGLCTWLLFRYLTQMALPQMAVLVLCILCALGVFTLCLHFLGIRFFRYIKTLITEG